MARNPSPYPKGLLQPHAAPARPLPALPPLAAIKVGELDAWRIREFADSDLPPHKDHEYKSAFSPEEEPRLFQYVPDFQDVQQVGIGDCYLLSALNALLRQADGVQQIYDMMSIDATHVTVRFIYIGVKIHVRVENTVIVEKKPEGTKPVHGHEQIWPYFIEKAYAFYRLYFLDASKGQKATYSSTGDYARDYQQAIEGGNAGTAYLHLTGRRFRNVAVRQVPPLVTRPDPAKPGNMITERRSAGIVHQHTERKYRCHVLRYGLADYQIPELMAYQLPGVNESRVHLFSDFLDIAVNPVPAEWTAAGITRARLDDAIPALQRHVAAVSQQHPELIGACIARINEKLERDEEMRREEIQKMVNALPYGVVTIGDFAVNYRKLLDRYIANSFAGKRGSGQYATYQVNLFEQIQARHKQGAFAATKAWPKKGDEIVPDRGTVEVMKKGLASRHAYEIAGVRRVLSNSPDFPNELLFIIIKNPWYNTVRRYFKKNKIRFLGDPGIVTLSSAELKQITDIGGDYSKEIYGDLSPVGGAARALSGAEMGSFPVELCDLTKYFDTIELPE